VCGLTPPFRRHERRIREDEIGFLVPARVVSERVVDVYRRIWKAVEKQIHLAQLHHQVSDIIAVEIRVDLLALIVRELVAQNFRSR